MAKSLGSEDDDLAAAGFNAFGSIFGSMKDEMMGGVVGKASKASGLPSLPSPPDKAPAAPAPAVGVADEQDQEMQAAQANDPESAVNQGIQDAETDPASGNNAQGKTPSEAGPGPGAGASDAGPGSDQGGSNAGSGVASGAGDHGVGGSSSTGDTGPEGGGSYKQGGVVQKTGKALVHAGEYVLTKEEVAILGVARLDAARAMVRSDAPLQRKQTELGRLFGSLVPRPMQPLFEGWR